MQPHSTADLRVIETADLFDADNAPVGYTIDDARLTTVRATIEKLNRRLARAGADEATRFEITTEPVLYRTNDGEITQTNLVTVNRPHVQVGPWAFGATVTTTDGNPDSPVMISGPEHATGTLSAETITDPTACQHCNVQRNRRKTYLLTHRDTGEVIQVGSTCLTPFLGVSVGPMMGWAEADVDDMILQDLDGERFQAGDATVGVAEVIAAALAVSEGGRFYVSRATAEQQAAEPTASLITTALGILQRGAPAQAAIYYRDQIQQYAPPETVAEVIAYAQNMDGDGEYPRAVKALADGERILAQHAGLLGSVVAAWHRANEAPASAEAPAEGYAAEVGARLKDQPLHVVVSKVRYFESQWGTSALVVLRDDQGHELTWWTSTDVDDLDGGDRLRLIGGTVKDHAIYRGACQTVLTRVKWEPAEQQ